MTKKVTVPAKYSDFANVFLKKSANILLEQIGANEYTIKLKQGKQLSYRHIYGLGPVQFEIFKIYIETKLANGFIRPQNC